MAEQVAEVFTEVVVAPAYDDGAVEVLAAKKNLRLLVSAPPAPRAASSIVRCRGECSCRPPTASRPRATTLPRGGW